MKEVKGNLWTYPADYRVITTNGTIKQNGECVMGRGCAAEAKVKFPWLPKFLGMDIRARGNVPHNYKPSDYPETIWTFPVKHNWHEKADIELIKASAEYLAAVFADPAYEGSVIVLPRPGCGNGQLDWADVGPILEPILDDKFHVITW